MLFSIGLGFVAVGLALVTLMWLSQRFLLSSPNLSPPANLPPVSILKPLKGVDHGFEENLRSFLELDYPRFEILFGVQEPNDPAIQVAEKLAAEYPHVATKLVRGGVSIGFNPKVNNLSNLAGEAKYETLLISDSNVEVSRDYLKGLVSHLLVPGVGLVSSPFCSQDEKGLGAALEGLQLNTFVMGGVSAVYLFLKKPCVVGKSMLFRRSDLERIGGFRFLGKYLGEDQVCGEEIAGLGKSIVVTPKVIGNRLGKVSVKQFVRRHIRWAMIRRRITPAGYAGEILLNSVFLTAILAALVPGLTSLGVFLSVLLYKSLLDGSAERMLGVKRNPACYPLLVFAKDMVIGLLWFVPWVKSTIGWRGNELRIGGRSELIPMTPPAPSF